jgi:DNA-binding transcriptional ArsR family regulator
MEFALRFFGALSDRTRLSIVQSLSESSLTVSQIHSSLGLDNISLSGVSHQLRLLHNLNIVVSKKSGREKTYSLSPNFCWCILKSVENHSNSNKHCSACSSIRAGGKK